MAADSHTDQDARSHIESYAKFSSMMKWGAIISFITAMLVMLIIAS